MHHMTNCSTLQAILSRCVKLLVMWSKIAPHEMFCSTDNVCRVCDNYHVYMGVPLFLQVVGGWYCYSFRFKNPKLQGGLFSLLLRPNFVVIFKDGSILEQSNKPQIPSPWNSISNFPPGFLIEKSITGQQTLPCSPPFIQLSWLWYKSWTGTGIQISCGKSNFIILWCAKI